MIRWLSILVGGSVGLWAAAAYPLRWLWGDAAVVHAAVAMGLCVLPALAALPWAAWARTRSPEQQLAMVLGATALRMAIVLGGTYALVTWVEAFRRPSFWWSVLGFYLFTLAVEVGLVVRGRTASNRG